MNKGQNLWLKAKKIIPGGNMLLSKRSEMFLPDQWPSYYSKVKGANVWDLDGNKYIDMSIMGVGACILGYCDDDVDQAVKKAIDLGVMSTLNAPEEVELAELLLKIDPWASMVRFCRTGGEAMSIAVRIARAYSSKDVVAFSGYHGWHDWYLSSNLANEKNLDGQLLPGLQPNGVPRNLKGTAIPFEFNRIDQLREIISKNQVGVIIIETVRNFEASPEFFKEIRKIADEIGAVLIFDEITSGWRLNVGGAFKKYNVNPDIVVYGKAMANGYAMGAIVGKETIMQAAQTSFISSTFWTERIGPVAAINTINKLEAKNVPQHLIKIGQKISEGWLKIAKEHEINIERTGIYPLSHFNFKYGSKSNALKTLYTQEMLKRGYLASNSVYVCYAHTDEIVNKYLVDYDDVLKTLSKAISSNSIESQLKGPIAHDGFRRLN